MDYQKKEKITEANVGKKNGSDGCLGLIIGGGILALIIGPKKIISTTKKMLPRWLRF